MNRHTKHFSSFIRKLEDNFPKYFDGTYVGQCLPEKEADKLAVDCMREYAKQKFYPIPASAIENSGCLKCGRF